MGKTQAAAAGEASTPNVVLPGQRPPRPTLTTAANLAQLLPTGTVLAFQCLNPSFSSHGTCRCSANRYLTLLLILSCALSCAFCSFTDSVLHNGRVHMGVATFTGFRVLYPSGEEQLPCHVTRRLCIEWRDFLHAFFSVLVFLALAMSDSSVQSCLFHHPGIDTREYLVNLPLGVGFLASVVFMVFPTTRRGIGYSDMSPQQPQPQPNRAANDEITGGGAVAGGPSDPHNPVVDANNNKKDSSPLRDRVLDV